MMPKYLEKYLDASLKNAYIDNFTCSYYATNIDESKKMMNELNIKIISLLRYLPEETIKATCLKILKNEVFKDTLRNNNWIKDKATLDSKIEDYVKILLNDAKSEIKSLKVRLKEKKL